MFALRYRLVIAPNFHLHIVTHGSPLTRWNFVLWTLRASQLLPKPVIPPISTMCKMTLKVATFSVGVISSFATWVNIDIQ